MALEIDEAHAAALAHTRTYVAGIAAEQWSLPTPCDGWDVTELVRHIVVGNLWVAPLMTGESIADVGDRFDGDVLGADPVAAYDASAAAARSAFEAPGAMDAPAAVSYGPIPGSVYASHRFLDVLVHGWDVAAATGQDTALPPELVELCLAGVRADAAMIEGSGMFGADHTVPDGADAQATLLALLGRHP